MSGFECYKLYLAVKQHFNADKYDFFKYGGRISARESTYDRRNDKYFFQKLGQKYSKKEYVQFLVANFIDDSNFWIGQDSSEETYTKWKARRNSRSYIFKDECEKVFSSSELNITLTPLNGYYPPLLQSFNYGDVSIETFLILDRVLNFMDFWDRRISDDIIWPQIRKKCLKYDPFLGKIDSEKYKSILQEIIIK